MGRFVTLMYGLSNTFVETAAAELVAEPAVVAASVAAELLVAVAAVVELGHVLVGHGFSSSQIWWT